MFDSVRPYRWQPTTLPRPWDSPGKNTGVGCHFLLQCRKWKVKVKSLSRVWLSATPWTAPYQAPPSMGFSRQEYWSGGPLPSPYILWSYSIPYLYSSTVSHFAPGSKRHCDSSLSILTFLVLKNNIIYLFSILVSYISMCLPFGLCN